MCKKINRKIFFEKLITYSNSWTLITYNKVRSKLQKNLKIKKLVSDWLVQTNKETNEQTFKNFMERTTRNGVDHTAWWNHHFVEQHVFLMKNTKPHQFLTSIDQPEYHNNKQWCSSHGMVKPSFREKTTVFDEKY